MAETTTKPVAKTSNYAQVTKLQPFRNNKPYSTRPASLTNAIIIRLQKLSRVIRCTAATKYSSEELNKNSIPSEQNVTIAAADKLSQPRITEIHTTQPTWENPEGKGTASHPTGHRAKTPDPNLIPSDLQNSRTVTRMGSTNSKLLHQPSSLTNALTPSSEKQGISLNG